MNEKLIMKGGLDMYEFVTETVSAKKKNDDKMVEISRLDEQYI